MSNTPDEQNDPIIKASSIAADIVGGLAGAGIGAVVAGTEGAMAGAVAVPIVTRVIEKISIELAYRVLGRRERLRISTVIVISAEKIRHNLSSGQTLRSDEFFTETLDSRSPAEEIAEGVLVAAQRDHEEKKLPYYANLIANLAFRQDIDRGFANYFVRIASTLSYRQISLIAFLGQMEVLFPEELFYLKSHRPPATPATSYYALIYELENLRQQGISFVTPILEDERDQKFQPLEGMALLLFELMGLAEVDTTDLHHIANLLREFAK